MVIAKSLFAQSQRVIALFFMISYRLVPLNCITGKLCLGSNLVSLVISK